MFRFYPLTYRNLAKPHIIDKIRVQSRCFSQSRETANELFKFTNKVVHEKAPPSLRTLYGRTKDITMWTVNHCIAYGTLFRRVMREFQFRLPTSEDFDPAFRGYFNGLRSFVSKGPFEYTWEELIYWARIAAHIGAFYYMSKLLAMAVSFLVIREFRLYEYRKIKRERLKALSSGQAKVEDGDIVPSKPKFISKFSNFVFMDFYTFREILDARAEQREKVIAASKSITRMSKKIGFAIARFGFKLGKAIPVISKEQNVHQEIKDLIASCSRQFKTLEQLLPHNMDNEKYHSHTTHCLQEFIEGVSSYHFLCEFKIIGYHDLVKNYFEESIIQPTVIDYLLGISDMTGEIMK
ncbi:Translin, partial [Rozella allomycis CSF55]